MNNPSTDNPLYRSTAARLEQALGFEQPAWLAAYRHQAATWFQRHGLPHPRDEAWRFTPLGTVTEMEFVPPADDEGDPLGSGRGSAFPPGALGAHLANGKVHGPFGEDGLPTE